MVFLVFFRGGEEEAVESDFLKRLVARITAGLKMFIS